MDSVYHQIDFIAVENSDLVFPLECPSVPVFPSTTWFPQRIIFQSSNVCLSVLGDGGGGSVRLEYWCRDQMGEEGWHSAIRKDFHTIPLFKCCRTQPSSGPSLVKFTHKINFASVGWVRKSSGFLEWDRVPGHPTALNTDFYYLAALLGLWDLSSPTRNLICALHSGSWNPNHWDLQGSSWTWTCTPSLFLGNGLHKRPASQCLRQVGLFLLGIPPCRHLAWNFLPPLN